ncbi:MAG: NADH-quinone oxidoreductase subunit NuoE [Deinococcus sp.]|nr:NADH-quinone oxidoreductase subunit NuoE [Deinococcus sp.]
MEQVLSASTREKIQAHLAKYPIARSAIMGAFWLAQEQLGYLPRQAIREVAELIGLSEEQALGVATFYTMYYLKPVGQYRIHLCATLPCALRGAGQLYDLLVKRLGINAGETTADGRFSLFKAECLGSCATAPAAMINDDYWENLDQERLNKIVDALAAGQEPDLPKTLNRVGPGFTDGSGQKEAA